MNSSSAKNNKWGVPVPEEMLSLSGQRGSMRGDPPVTCSALCNSVDFFLLFFQLALC